METAESGDCTEFRLIIPTDRSAQSSVGRASTTGGQWDWWLVVIQSPVTGSLIINTNIITTVTSLPAITGTTDAQTLHWEITGKYMVETVSPVPDTVT